MLHAKFQDHRISGFGFKSGICLLIALVPVHCFSITLEKRDF